MKFVEKVEIFVPEMLCCQSTMCVDVWFTK